MIQTLSDLGADLLSCHAAMPVQTPLDTGLQCYMMRIVVQTSDTGFLVMSRCLCDTGSSGNRPCSSIVTLLISVQAAPETDLAILSRCRSVCRLLQIKFQSRFVIDALFIKLWSVTFSRCKVFNIPVFIIAASVINVFAKCSMNLSSSSWAYAQRMYTHKSNMSVFFP